MKSSTSQRLCHNARVLAAALGAGALIAMGALIVNDQPGAVDTNPAHFQAGTTLTVTAPPMAPSVAPTHKATFCNNNSPHAWADGCPWG
ncbi:hypothetical protein [Mycolicibacterium goodii]|uniref:hypothetical protein n=1 Tax=Mycolicibacterium goodii TaxID=134601 RepID=UPI000AC8CE45